MRLDATVSAKRRDWTMGQAADGASFGLDGNRLSVSGTFGPEDEKQYSEALFELLNTGGYVLELDLTKLDYINSSYIGATTLAIKMARQNKRSLKIIACEEIARVLSMVGVDSMTVVEVVAA